MNVYNGLGVVLALGVGLVSLSLSAPGCDQGIVATSDSTDMGTQFADNPSPSQDVPVVRDTFTPDPDTAGPQDTAVPDVPPDIPPDTGPVCTNPASKPIMAPCEDDCECATGFCYKEAFLGDFSFCSLDCSLNDTCNQLTDGDGVKKYMCLNFAGSLASNYDLTVTHLCVLRCEDVAECKSFASAYDQCGNASAGLATSWDGHTIAMDKACLIQSKINP